MIQREIDLAKLDDFDWHRDMMETYQWLRNVGRIADATKLLDADRERFYREYTTPGNKGTHPTSEVNLGK